MIMVAGLVGYLINALGAVRLAEWLGCQSQQARDLGAGVDCAPRPETTPGRSLTA